MRHPLAHFCCYALPERMGYPGIHAASVAMLDGPGQPGWLKGYAPWELVLPEARGFGRDLDQCAVTGCAMGGR